MKLAILLVTLAPLFCRAQDDIYTVAAVTAISKATSMTRMARNGARLFVTAPAIGPANFYKFYQLNQWIAKHGAPKNSSLLSVDILTMVVQLKNGMNNGFSLGIIIPPGGGRFSSFYFDWILGMRMYQNKFFESNLNGHFTIMENSIQSLVPPSLGSGDPNNKLQQDGFGLGLSSANYFTVWNGRNKGHSFDLLFGVEGGVTMLWLDNWQYGHNEGYGKYRHFVGVYAPEVPNVCSYLTYLKFSVSMRF